MIPSRFTLMPNDVPLFLFTLFALLCLFTSALWHTMTGCAHRNGMVLSAKLDYVGIGWLICASIGTFVWYGFMGFDGWQRFYLGACVATAIAGTILPFYDWFNTPQHKVHPHQVSNVVANADLLADDPRRIFPIALPHGRRTPYAPLLHLLTSRRMHIRRACRAIAPLIRWRPLLLRLELP
jgi:hypothetical protein